MALRQHFRAFLPVEPLMVYQKLARNDAARRAPVIGVSDRRFAP
jgi:hypothetical protein